MPAICSYPSRGTIAHGPQHQKGLAHNTGPGSEEPLQGEGMRELNFGWDRCQIVQLLLRGGISTESKHRKCTFFAASQVCRGYDLPTKCCAWNFPESLLL